MIQITTNQTLLLLLFVGDDYVVLKTEGDLMLSLLFFWKKIKCTYAIILSWFSYWLGILGQHHMVIDGLMAWWLDGLIGLGHAETSISFLQIGVGLFRCGSSLITPNWWYLFFHFEFAMFFELSFPHMKAFALDALFMLPKAAVVVNLLPNDRHHRITVTFFPFVRVTFPLKVFLRFVFRAL